MSSLSKKIALIQGGYGSEKEISHLSGKAVAQSLETLNLAYQTIEADPLLPQKLLALKPKIVFLAVHGQYAEDGTIQSICEYLKIPYTGSGVLASSVCMDKCFFKNFITKYNIPTPSYQSVDLKSSSFQLKFPLVVKPAREGSSMGISICHDKLDFDSAVQRARKYDAKVLLESYVEGQELALSFLNGKFLTPIEVKPKTGFYDYKNKYTAGQTEYILPPNITSNILQQCQEYALKVIQALQIRSYCRTDFIISQGTPWMIEMNTLPGLTSSSLLPKSANYDGISFNSLVTMILEGASLDYENSY